MLNQRKKLFVKISHARIDEHIFIQKLLVLDTNDLIEITMFFVEWLLKSKNKKMNEMERIDVEDFSFILQN